MDPLTAPPHPGNTPLNTWLRSVYSYLTQLVPTISPTLSVWDDLSVNLLSEGTLILPAGSTDPTQAEIVTGVRAWQFSGSARNEMLFSKTLSHRYRQAGRLRAYLQWSPSGTSTSSLTWGLIFTLASIGGTFGAAQTLEVSVAAPGVVNRHVITDLGEIDATGLRESAHIVGLLYRKGNTDANSQAAFAHVVGFHHEVNRLGTAVPSHS